MRRLALMLILAATLACGCTETRFWPSGQKDQQMQRAGRTPADHPFQPPAQQDPAADVPSYDVMTLQFEVLRIDLPLTRERHSQKIWNHADELRAASSQAATLLRNGLRVGICTHEDWPALQAIFQTAHGQMARQYHTVQGAAEPLTVELGNLPEPVTVFAYDDRDRLSGQTIPAGDLLMIVEYSLQPRMFGAIDLRLSLEIRHDTGAMKWENVGGVIRQVPDYDRFVFDGTVLNITLREGEFLVVGLSGEDGSDLLIGHRFLTVERGGEMFESILCITPRTTRSEVGGEWQAAGDATALRP